MEALAPWFSNFALKFNQLAADLGFSGAEIAAVKNDELVVQWLLDAENAFEANLDGFRKFRDESLYGEKNDPAPVEPVTVLPAAPAEFTSAIIERLVNLVERIQLAPKYTEEIGAQFDILGKPADSIAPEDLKPVLKVKALPNFQIQIEFKRGDTNGILIQTQTGAENTWTEAGRFFSSPAMLTVGCGTPQTVRLRGRYLMKNEPVGEYSDIFQIVTNP